MNDAAFVEGHLQLVVVVRQTEGLCALPGLGRRNVDADAALVALAVDFDEAERHHDEADL